MKDLFVILVSISINVSMCFSQKTKLSIPDYAEKIPYYSGLTIDSVITIKDKTIYGPMRDRYDSLNFSIPFSGGGYSTLFKKQVNLENITFLDKIDFTAAEFSDIVSIRGCTFENVLSFERARFHKELYISNTKFKKSPNLNFAQLPELFMFWPSNLDSLAGVIDFTNCRIDSLKKYKNNLFYKTKCRIAINIESTKDFESLQLFFKKVILPSQLFELQFTRLIDPTDSHDNHTQLYEALIGQSKKLGMIESTQGWEIEYEKYKIEHSYNFLNFRQRFRGQLYRVSYLPLGTIMNFISENWWNFGYSKSKILLIWLPIFYILFVIINYLNLDWMVGSVYSEPNYGKNFKLKFENIKSRYDKISYSLFYTAMIFFNFKLDPEAVNYKNLKGLIYLYIIYVVGTIHVAFGIIGYIFK